MASPNVIDSSQELLDAQAHVWNHMLSYVNAMVLKCALQLGIPDIIHKHDKPITLSQLVHALRINETKSDGLYRLMQVLVHSKFFDKIKIDEGEEEKEAYSLTRVSRLLLKDEPLGFAPLALIVTDPIMINPFHRVTEWFHDECPSPFVTTNGMNFWEFAGKDDMWNQRFNEAMASDARLVGSRLVKECKHVFEGLKTVVDVAGGTGTVAKAIAAAFPGLKAVVLDLPHVVAGLEGSENVRFVSGDMFDFIPPADAVFLKWIMHDWGDEDCIKLLGKCKEAIISSKNITGGKVIIMDMVVDVEKQEHVATETQLFVDMLLLANFSGKERSEKEWAKLFAAAGFKNYKITHTFGLRKVQLPIYSWTNFTLKKMGVSKLPQIKRWNRY